MMAIAVDLAVHIPGQLWRWRLTLAWVVFVLTAAAALGVLL